MAASEEYQEARSAADTLRRAMRLVASTVAVVTAGHEGDVGGATVTSVTSVSMDPPTLLVCVNRSVRLNTLLQAAGAFRVNYLGRGHEEVARAFGGGSGADRFRVGRWDLDAVPAPELVDALAQISCRLDGAFECGTHTIFVGAVKDVRLGSGDEPLLYCNGGYARLAAA